MLDESLFPFSLFARPQASPRNRASYSPGPFSSSSSPLSFLPYFYLFLVPLPELGGLLLVKIARPNSCYPPIVGRLSILSSISIPFHLTPYKLLTFGFERYQSLFLLLFLDNFVCSLVTRLTMDGRAANVHPKESPSSASAPEHRSIKTRGVARKVSAVSGCLYILE